MVALNSLTRKVQKLENLHYLQSELDLRQELLRALAMERTRQELADAAQTDDTELVDRLHKAGFTPETLPALTLAPLALVAWGSGDVTQEERSAAIQAVFESEVSGNRLAIRQFQSWLERRPDPGLLTLWAEFTQAKMLRSGASTNEVDRVMYFANQVAMASGGFLGYGSICEGEQAIIDRVCNVLNTILGQ